MLSIPIVIGCGNRICSEVIGGVVVKCLNARPKTKDLGVSICLMYIEIEKQETVMVSFSRSCVCVWCVCVLV